MLNDPSALLPHALPIKNDNQPSHENDDEQNQNIVGQNIIAHHNSTPNFASIERNNNESNPYLNSHQKNSSNLQNDFGANIVQERQKYSHLNSVDGSGPSENPVSSQTSLKNPLINQQNRDTSSGSNNYTSHHHHPGQNPYFNNMNPSFLCPPNHVNPHLTMENPGNGSGSDPANIYGGGVSMYSSTGQDNLNYDKVE